MNDTNVTLALLLLSCLVAMGGPVCGFLLGHLQGWDGQVYDYCMICFPAGLVAMFLTAWLIDMVDERHRKQHEAEMDAIWAARK